MHYQIDINKIFLFTKDSNEPKYELLINKGVPTDLKYFNDPKAFIEYFKDMNDVSIYIDDYNPNKKRKVITVFDDIIKDMVRNKKLEPIVTELFIGKL